jgi:hypothetical protein
MPLFLLREERGVRLSNELRIFLFLLLHLTWILRVVNFELSFDLVSWTMAQQNAFNTALTRIGFNVDTTERIIDEGFDTLETLADLKESDIDDMIKNVRETRRALGANAPGDISFPFLPIKRLKAMRFWAVELKRTGRPLNAGLFTGALITTALTRYALDLLRSELKEDETIDKPKELADLIKWETFWEQWKTYMGRLRGAAKCPLSYVFRDHEQVEPAMHLQAYDDHDSRLIATTELTDSWFEVDNHRMYDEFKALVLKGPGWSFIKGFDRTKNGREAVLTLRRQCEGTSAIQSRKAAACAKIAAARYTGHKKSYTFDNYVESHQNAHNTLVELNEGVPETKKVTDFLAGISDPRLSNAKDLILGDPDKLQNFEACQQYLKTLVYNKATQEKHERQISGLAFNQDQNFGKTSDAKNNKQPGKGKGKRSGGADGAGGNKVEARQYTRAEWFKLTPEQRAKIKELRASKRHKARNASSAQTDQPETIVAAEPTAVSSVTQEDNGSRVPPTSRGGRSQNRN